MKFKCIDNTQRRVWFQPDEPKSFTRGKIYFGRVCDGDQGPIYLLLYSDLGRWERTHDLHQFVPVDG